MSPGNWTDIEFDGRMNTSEYDLHSLSVREVVARKREGGDYTNLIQNGIPILIAIGKSQHNDYSWSGDYRDADGIYWDYITSPGGEPLRASDLAEYFQAIQYAVTSGSIDHRDDLHELSDALLMLGYFFFQSDSTLASFEARNLLLYTAYRAGMSTNLKLAQQSSDVKRVKYWEQQLADLYELRKRLKYLGYAMRDTD